MSSLQHIDRNEIFELAYRFVTETSENIFLTGKAGTGKTTFLKYLKENCTKNIVVAAPTGVAAINAGGVTLHSLFQLPFQPFLPTSGNKSELLSKIRYNKQRQQLLRKMELLVIDEISMVRCDVMDALDTILKSIRRNYDTPFGGVQLLCIGDLYQLPPVAQNHEWSILQEYYSSPFFFDSLAVKEQMPLLIELDKIYRQKEDSFVRLLNKVRNNDMTADDFEDLHMRYDPTFRPSREEKYITLTSHNKQADEINQMQLYRLFGDTFTYTATVDDEFPEHIYPAEYELILKEGAQVMFLKNDLIQKRYFNGKIGVVKSLEKERIIVEVDGFDIDVAKETWENTRYTLNRTDGKLEQETIGTFSQYPLRLAWAITIHKSQGLTFDKVMIDAGAAFSSGQVYVALSRCTSLEGIVLLSKIPVTAIQSNGHVKKGQQTLTHKGSLAERFAGARQLYTLQLLEEIFSFADIDTTIGQLHFQVKQHIDKLNPEAAVWIQTLQEKFLTDKSVGLKFISLVASLMKDEGIIENNQVLQQRISDAANHFIPKFSSLQQQIQNQPLVTEHKEAVTEINEHLVLAAQSIYATNYFLQYCRQPFSVTSFLQHKLKFAQSRFNINCYASAKKETVSNSDIPNVELYNTLKRWRDMVVEESGQPIYMVAKQDSLREIALYLPLTKKDLMQISGFGKAKVETYGADIIEAVESYCHRHGLETNMFSKAIDPKKEKKEKSTEPKIDTKTVSFDLYKEGKTVDEIATIRNLTKNTIEGHLTNFISTGEIDINELVNKEKQQQIKNAIKLFGAQSHKTLVENLPGISYGEIKMVLAVEK
ncbi:helix-turn-helix domain-containing protein [Ferruginibacter lapsinanis]|uniref:helix-turn-helix domain-containing protein n=1 Tax=Ferruginibacter lapsinanis TaxID=563172 RepID=UPI001E3B4223|nr:helix-turn-helix domain-containing protein [Ferruginibacter lapsinanis]UEG50748.1 helix-turn-helix domain-containing protein [Ferruginibacter lapsinanis]